MSLVALAAASVATVCLTVQLPQPPAGSIAVPQAELPGLLVGKALWDEVMSPPNIYDRPFVIAFGPGGRTILDSGLEQARGSYSFKEGEVCLTGYGPDPCFRLYRTPDGALLRTLNTKDGQVFTPVYWMPEPGVLPPGRPAIPAHCERAD